MVARPASLVHPAWVAWRRCWWTPRPPGWAAEDAAGGPERRSAGRQRRQPGPQPSVSSCPGPPREAPPAAGPPTTSRIGPARSRPRPTTRLLVHSLCPGTLPRPGPPPACDLRAPDLLGPPPKITNGNYTFSDITMFQYFEAVTYSCNPTLGPDQLSLVGSEVLYCAAHETWSSAAPECKVIKCPSPVLKDGRQLSGFGKSFYYKAMVKFECMAGFYLNGSDTIMCGTENAWEPSIPQCIKGPRPTQPVKSPVYNYPGYPNPHEGLFDQELIVAVAVLPLFVHRCVEHHNKSTKLTDDSHKEIKFTSL
ncbi:membrane cofactor protein isoform X2 [Heterocephalus glaber]|uniref:Membrane cofactor protein n=1 Tax=Heterocephalus glaber TaxID=10181 RepID=A0AAX6RMM2_HETGA|nr:membrane cofactor protein isoform X2 [Heterocephalus glaber]XP_021098042.1 membrane cofactor protein isoform X2 [Heterocephalus glaber]